MGLFAFILILMKRFIKKSNAIYKKFSFAYLIIAIVCWSFSVLSMVYAAQGRITFGDATTQQTYLMQGGSVFMPLAVYCLIKGFAKKQKIHGLIPSIAIPLVVSLICSLSSSILRSAAFNATLNSNLSAVISLQSGAVAILAISAVTAGFFAVSWMEYIDAKKEIMADEDTDREEPSYQERKTAEYSYLEEYKKKMKEGKRDV